MDKSELVLIELDRPRFLWCGFKALKVMQELLGKPITEFGDEFSPVDVEKIIYAMLLKDAQQHGETLTLDQVEDLLDDVKFPYVVERMAAAMSVAFDAGDGKNAQMAAEKNSVGEQPYKPLPELE